jgi:phenylacetate-CoA ligase
MLPGLVRNISYPFWDRREGGIRLGEYRRLKRAQWAPWEERDRYQRSRLQSMLRHAFQTVPYYRSVWTNQQLDAVLADASRLNELPVLRKADIRRHAAELISESLDRDKLIAAKTGGSTGVALEVRFDAACQQLRNGAEMWANDLAGWRPGVLVGALWGSPPVPATLKQKIRNTFHDRVFYLDTMALNPETMRAFLKKVIKRDARLLFGHAHSLYELAVFARETDAPVPGLDGIVATSMMLLAHQRAVIEEVFDTRVTDRYGCEEVGLIACEARECGNRHLNTDHLVVEIIDDDDCPVEDGIEGRIVLTDLNNRGMPLVRYEVGDMGAISRERCHCGRGLASLVSLTGRMADYFIHPDGSRISGISLVEKTLTAIDGLEELQLIQETRRLIRARAIARSTVERQVADEIRRVLTVTFTDEITVDVEFIDRLDQSPSGKYRFAICRVRDEDT